MRRLSSAVTFTALSLAMPDAGVAGTPPQIAVALDYQAPPADCADTSGFRDSVQHQLGYDPFRTPADRKVSVRIAHGEGGYEGRIQWTDGHGHELGDRKLSTRHPGCIEIINNLAFAVAVQIQLLAAVAPAAPAPAEAPIEPPPAPSPSLAAPAPSAAVTGSARAESAVAAVPPVERPLAPEAPPPAAAAAVREPPSPVGRQPPRKLALSLGVGPSLALGLAPRPTATGRIFAVARVAWFSFELGFEGALPVRRQEAGDAAFTLHRLAGEAAACGRSHLLSVCAVGALGRLEAEGAGVDVPRQPAGLSAQLGARLIATEDLGSRYFVALRLEGVVLVSRWTVVVNDVPVWTTPRFASLIGVDVGARIF